MAVEIDPLSSADGTPVTVESTRGEGRAKTQDEAVIDLLLSMNDTLMRILTLLELEFELQTEEFTNGEN